MLGQQCFGAMGLGRRSSGRAAALAGAAVAALALAAPAVAGIGPTTRESLTGASGQQANGASFGASLSADGSLVAFQSNASDLVPGDTNNFTDVFVRDRINATTTRVSVASNGAQANNTGMFPAISGDGRYVAFSSGATNLDPGATSGFGEVYVRDLTTGNTSRVSRTPTGGEPDSSSGGDAVSISRDGRYVAFTSSATNLVPGGTPGQSDFSPRRVYVYDTKADKTVLVAVTSAGAPADGEQPSISADGRYVAFSAVRALVPGDTNGVGDVYIRDRDADGNGIFDEAGAGKTSTTLVSVALDGTSAGNANSTGRPLDGPLALSADGRQVAFASNASNLVADDTNSKTDVFVRDLRAGKTARVSVASDGSQGNDRSGGFATGLALSADGRRVAFASDASNLVAGDRNFKTDVFVHDRDADGNGTFDEAGAGKATTTLESVSTGGTQGDDASGGGSGAIAGVSLTGDGTGLAFGSFATNLVAGDTNAVSDVFFRRLAPPTQSTLTVVKAGAGQGTVTSSPAGIDCGSSCAHAFDTGTLVRLTAAPAAGSSFAGFTGTGCAGAAATCTATVDESRSVTATFAVAQTGGGGNPPPGGGGNPPPGGGGSPPPAGGGNPPPGGGGNPPPPPPPPPPPSAPPAATGLVPGLGAVRDTSAPVVSGFGLTNDPFVVGGSTPTFGRAAKKAKRHKKGTTFGYTLSKDATVKIVISQAGSGRRRGRRCVAPTRKLRNARRCTRIITKGTLTRTSHPGSNRVAFSGRIGSRKLAPGRYQATLTATDAAKNASKPQTIAFTIVRR